MSAVPPPTRRDFLAGAATALVLAPGGCNRRSDDPLVKLAVGFLRQTDAASLLIGEELGTYAKHGVAPALRRGASPAELATRLTSGELVAAQLPASLPLMRTLINERAAPTDLVTLMVLSHNGAAITLARDLCQGVKFLDLVGLREALERRPSAAAASFAVPAIGGTDDLWLRYVLAAAGVPRTRINIVEIPVERMLLDLREERIVGFAAPDPWPALAVAQDVGFTFATAQDICRHAPRSVLATTAATLEERRPQLKKLVRAVIEASVWLDTPANRGRPLLGESLARRQGLDLDAAPIRARLGSVYDLGCRLGERDFEDDMLFFHHAGRVSLPRRADALLLLALLTRFRLGRMAGVDAVDRVIRDDIYRELSKEMGLPLPDDMKPFVVTLDAVRFDAGVPADWPGLWGG